MKRLIAAVLLAVFAAVGFAQPAFAHNTLTSSNPKDGSSIAAAPDTVTLTFNDDVQPGEGNQIVVSGPGDTRWTSGSAQVDVDGTKAGISLPPLGPAGEYTIAYRILSADGHVVKDVLSFTLTEDGDGKPLSTGADDGGEDSGGLPLWVWIVGAVVLLGAGLVFALRLGREQE